MLTTSSNIAISGDSISTATAAYQSMLSSPYDATLYASSYFDEFNKLYKTVELSV